MQHGPATVEGGFSRGLPLSWVWASLAVIAPVTLAFGSVSTIDLSYLIRAGQITLSSGHILRTDVFTFTAHCLPWVNQQWGAEIVLAKSFDALGWLGLVLVRAVVTAAAAGCIFAACRAYGARRRAASWLTLLAFLVAIGGFQLRSQLFGLAFFSLLQWLVADRILHPRRLWWLIPVFAIWANVHGSFPIGLFALAIAWLEDRDARRSGRTLLAVTLLSALATLATPFGAGVWKYVIDVSTDPYIRRVVVEWHRPGITSYTGVVFYASAALAVMVLVRNRRWIRWPTWIGLAAFLVLAASSIRSEYWWGIVLAVTFARLPWAAREPASDVRHQANAILIGALCLAPIVAVLRWIPYTNQAPPGQVDLAPPALTERLRTLLAPGEPFTNPQAWGSWFEQSLPGHPVFVDSRFEIVPADAMLASLRMSQTASGWRRDLAALPTRVLVVDREERPLVAALTSMPDWERVYADEDGLIFVRLGAPPTAALPACPAGTT